MDTLNVKVGKIIVKNIRVQGGTQQGQERLNQVAKEALVHLIVAIVEGKEK